ncbi:hypothetical protein H4R20_003572 [Coemansia guatemalensis]|uniref:Carbohydrate-binding module family 96 domain-containing protein n=1 Tax=Coemansia guatemalensis TaxID=2761395 RepID=A0A9W8HT20_9FUNG|nr:hypothetical protein H4R20_003572 [Coemansia guatemalensis]
MKFCSAVIALVATTLATVVVAESRNITTPAVQDATILRSSTTCAECPESDCNKCALGRNNTLVASTGVSYYQALVGFHMPVAAFQVKSCSVQIPAMLRNDKTINVIISQAGTASWSEDTVNSGNAPNFGNVIASVQLPPYNNLGPVDVTTACRSAIEGEFSLYFAAGTERYEFWSRDSGNPALLHITTNDNDE